MRQPPKCQWSPPKVEAPRRWRPVAGNWQGRSLRAALARRIAGFHRGGAALAGAWRICIVTCAFSEMNGMALRSFRRCNSPKNWSRSNCPRTIRNYQRYAAHRDVFSSTLAYIAAVPFGVSMNGSTERRWGHLVTPSYFSTLGVRPALGRFFDPAGAAGARDSGGRELSLLARSNWPPTAA